MFNPGKYGFVGRKWELPGSAFSDAKIDKKIGVEKIERFIAAYLLFLGRPSGRPEERGCAKSRVKKNNP